MTNTERTPGAGGNGVTMIEPYAMDKPFLSAIRHKLVNMNTREPITIGALTIRFFKTRAYNRWQIEFCGSLKSFSYAVYPEQDYIMGTIDQIGVRNRALEKALAYIVANYHAAPPAEPKRCGHCGAALVSLRSRYCSAECSQAHANERYVAKRKAADGRNG
jgi:hypothetical protein